MLWLNKHKKSLCWICVVVVLVGLFFFVRPAFLGNHIDTTNESVNLDELITRFTHVAYADGYDEYLSQYAELPFLETSLTATVSEGVEKKDDAYLLREGSSIEFIVNAPAALAAIRLQYRVLSANSVNAEVQLELNGKQPFQEASGFILRRDWLTAGVPKEDERGNQYSVELVESEEWITTTFSDSTGYHSEPFNFALEEGRNTLRLTSLKNDILISSLTMFGKEVAASAHKGTSSADINLQIIEAEFPAVRTDPAITELCDRQSADTTPVFGGIQKWNALGGTGWGTVGQQVTWKIDVKKDGYYALNFRYLQNFNSGAATFRALTVDGVSPFAGAENIRFPYDGKWKNQYAVNTKGEVQYIYLSAGSHEISLEVTLGEMAKALNVAESSLFELNTLYREVLMLTGSSPDQYRDYQIEKNLPEMLKVMEEEADILQRLSLWLVQGSGGEGSVSSTVDVLVRLLEGFCEDPESIPGNLDSFQSSLTTFSSWLQERISQPLTLDKIILVPQGTVYEEEKAGLLDRTVRSVSLFFRSFMEDYGVIGKMYDESEAVEVWITMGRDQYQIMKEQIDNDFSAAQGIPVNLKLTAGGVLQAISAGIAPDVYLFCGEGDPVNFAARGALTDLTIFPDCQDVVKRFAPETLVPYTYDDGLYALPLSQEFDMLFVRDDILEDMGLAVPQTWEEVYTMLSILQQNKMEFGYPMPSSGSVSSFALTLMQRQQNFYYDNGKRVAFDTEEALVSFEQWVKLYSEFQLLQSYNFVNRFRSGDMPIGVASFSTYNTLAIFAPEIRGLWSMVPVPGIRKEDGSIQRYTLNATTGAFIVKDSRLQEESWEFLKWWTGAQAQGDYAAAIENRLGISGRYNTANLEAFETIAWSADTLKSITAARQQALSLQQVPGGYFLSRHVDNIFREVINKNADVRETVYKYTDIINDELRKKRLEFGLEVDDE